MVIETGIAHPAGGPVPILSPSDQMTTTSTASGWETSAQEGSLSTLREIIAVHTLHLSPKHLGNVSAGIKETLTGMLLQWNEGLKAVPIVYTKADWHQSQDASAAPILYDNPCVHVTVRVRWLAFCPKKGGRTAGSLANQGPEYLGLLLMNYFNVTIQAAQLKTRYEWNDEAASWHCKKTGKALEAGDKVDFEILGHSTEGGMLVVFGSVDKLYAPEESRKSTTTAKGWTVAESEGKPKKDKTKRVAVESSEPLKKKSKKHRSE